MVWASVWLLARRFWPGAVHLSARCSLGSTENQPTPEMDVRRVRVQRRKEKRGQRLDAMAGPSPFRRWSSRSRRLPRMTVQRLRIEAGRILLDFPGWLWKWAHYRLAVVKSTIDIRQQWLRDAHLHTHTHTHTRARAHTHAPYTRTHTHTHAHTHARVHTHTHTRTHRVCTWTTVEDKSRFRGCGAVEEVYILHVRFNLQKFACKQKQFNDSIHSSLCQLLMASEAHCLHSCFWCSDYSLKTESLRLVVVLCAFRDSD